MPNISVLLKGEITRLARREIRRELASVRTANIAHRHNIAVLKRQVAALEHKSIQLVKRARSADGSASAELPGRQVRFVAKGLVTMRKRLGLSASQLGALIGMSEQSVYNWETKKATPRKDALAAIIELRGVGKREVQRRLSEMTPSKSTPSATKRDSGKSARKTAMPRRRK